MADQTIQHVEVDGGVVVGVDGSPSSLRALAIAADEARIRDAVLHVVRAWSIRTAPRPPDCPPNAIPSVDQFHDEVLKDTQRIVAQRIGEDPGITIRYHVAHAPSPHALLSASKGADVIVVGHRGRGGFAGLMLGSVAEQCVRHAACPVLVVRPNV
ncbi:universal stress protein [Saccharopolyspora cebuensis]|uniref:Universal stress protein n=1 Tax=Saccharopolyspora cebuensis TaxID=418759 RepID=A0ABV4CI19_9PSEU